MDVNFNNLNQDNIFVKSLNKRLDGNIFAAAQSASIPAQVPKNPVAGRLNDFDSSILENNAYQDISDEMLKIEHKMGLLENFLAKTMGEIEGLESLGQAAQVQALILRKLNIEKELTELNKRYKELGFSSMISGQIASAVGFSKGKKKGSFSKIKKFIARNFLSRISKKFSYSQNMREALEKLSNINSNVDELITLQTPYGEKVERYEKLTAYLNKANVIHSQIAKNLKDVQNS